MRVLVTGGAGFIGSHLTERLLSLGHCATVIDDLSTGSMDNLASVEGHPAFRCYLNSIFERDLLAKLVHETDAICHLAASVGVRRVLDEPVDSIERNVGGAALLLSLAAKERKRVLLTSTSEVYGQSLDLPLSETGELVFGATSTPRWSYGCSKALNEFLALAYHCQSKLPVTILRLFNTVGPRQTGAHGMVLPTFVAQALTDRPLTVFGSGQQTRCFTYVADVIDGIVASLTSDRAVGEIFNLGGTEEISINELAARVITCCKSKSTIRHVPYHRAYGSGFEDVERRVPDISKALRVLGYATRWLLNDMIEAVVEDARRRIAMDAQLLFRAG